MAERLLSGLRALDLTDEKGFVCGQILSTLGVDVTKVEKPGGDSARNIPPFYQDKLAPQKSLYWFAFNTDKRSITLDLETARGQDLFRKLVARTDFVLESFSPGHTDRLGIGYEALCRVNKRIIVTSITHFGQKGPHSGYKGSELVDSAMSGVLDNTGHPDRPPVKEAIGTIYFHAGAAAALGTLISHYCREITGEGQQVDVSIQEVAASRTILCLLPWQWDKRLIKRAGPIGQIGFRPFRHIWPCKDGYVSWMFNGGPIGAPANRALSQWIDEEGMENPLSQVTNWEEFDRFTMPQQMHDAFQEAIGKFFLRRTKREIAEEGLKRGINAVIASDPADVLSNPQLLARNYWAGLEHPDLGTTFKYPRHFFLCSETENYTGHPAPNIGQDNTEVYVTELGLTSREIAELKKTGVI